MKYVKRVLDIAFVVLLDVVMVIGAFLSAYYVRSHGGLFVQNKETPFFEYVNLLPFVIVISLFSFQFCGIYRRSNKTMIDQIPNIFFGSGLATVLLMLMTFIFKMYPYSRIVLFLFWILTFIYLILWRGIWASLRKQFRKSKIGLTNAVIIGSNPMGLFLARELNQSEKTGYQVIGFLDDQISSDNVPQETIPFLGSTKELDRILRDGLAGEVFVAVSNLPSEKMAQLTILCTSLGIRLNFIPDLQEIIVQRATLTDLFGIPLIVVEEQIFYLWNRFLKRILDVTFSVIMMILSLPLTIPIAIWIRFDPKSAGPVFFKQERIGRKGRKFWMYKFRSMKIGAEEQVVELASLNVAKGPLFKIPNDPRITTVGKFIRRWSLDEFPQFINVLKNEMSLVGPRPPLQIEVDKYEEWQKKRLEIQPGMTGLWQVSGRSELPFDEMVKLDLYYIEHWSLWLDIKILLRTIITVIQGKGAY